MTRPFLLAAMMATGAPVRLRAQPASSRRPLKRSCRLVVLRLGPAWTRRVPTARHPALVAHGEYVERLFDEGTLLITGPLLNNSGMVRLEAVTGAVLVLRAATPKQARRLAEADPAVRAGLLQVAQVRPWGTSRPRGE